MLKLNFRSALPGKILVVFQDLSDETDGFQRIFRKKILYCCCILTAGVARDASLL